MNWPPLSFWPKTHESYNSSSHLLKFHPECRHPIVNFNFTIIWTHLTQKFLFFFKYEWTLLNGVLIFTTKMHRNSPLTDCNLTGCLIFTLPIHQQLRCVCVLDNVSATLFLEFEFRCKARPLCSGAGAVMCPFWTHVSICLFVSGCHVRSFAVRGCSCLQAPVPQECRWALQS